MADESAILIPVQESEELVGPYRQRYDPVARAGVPAHVTVLYPFREPRHITSRDISELQQVVGGFEQFDFWLAEVRGFPGVIYLHPEPDEIFRTMTHALVSQFPDFPPYRGAYPTIKPHLTVAQCEPDELTTVGEGFRADAESCLPIKSRAEEVWLMVEQNGFWSRKASFPLRQLSKC